MARPKAKAPARRYHISGQSVVTLDGKDFYLGPHDSPQAIARYAVLIGIYLKLPGDFDSATLDERAAFLLGFDAPAQQASQPILVRHVTAAYRGHVATKYPDNPAELHRLNQVCDELDTHAGDKLASDYGPLALQQQRGRWIDTGNSRGYVNRLTNAVVRIYKYAVAQELVSSDAWQRLKSVEPLRAGQSDARESSEASRQ